MSCSQRSPYGNRVCRECCILPAQEPYKIPRLPGHALDPSFFLSRKNHYGPIEADPTMLSPKKTIVSECCCFAAPEWVKDDHTCATCSWPAVRFHLYAAIRRS